MSWRDEMRSALIQDEILEKLSYNHETGVVSWRVETGRGLAKRYPGDPAGTLLDNGYLQIKVAGKKYLAHRIAYAIMRFSWPDGEIDHINGVRSDNRWCNLRVATRAQNKRNEKVRRSALGVPGVRMSRGKYRSTIVANGVRVLDKTFDTLSEAEDAANAARQTHHGEYASTGRIQ